MKTRLAALLACCVALPFAPRGAVAQVGAEGMRERLGTETANAEGSLLAGFYERRGYRPAWVSDSGPLPAAWELLASIGAASRDGLDSSAYPLSAIRHILERGGGPDRLVGLELMLSRTLLTFARRLSRGRIEPATVDSIWTASPSPLDLTDLALAIDSMPVEQALSRSPPPQPGYVRLREALAHYRDLAARGGWPAIPEGEDLSPGSRGPRVGVLRERLARESGVATESDSGEVYDDGLAQAIRRFQTIHGLDADGVVGPATRAALNLSAAERVRQIELNLERWRWLPRNLGGSYIMVNSAAFTLDLVVLDHQIMTMRAIVGRADWPTPIVSSRITSLAFSPVWEIPRAIALAEVVPLVCRDPRYLARERITVFQDSGRAAREVDPLTIDWGAVVDSTFNLRLRQAPGEGNPLGGMKLLFGSRFDVRIHDTPARSLFRQRLRTFSHGCVRVERAAELATVLLQDSTRWPLDSVRARMRRPDQQLVVLSSPIPVHLAYWTAWADDDGTVQFRDDVYGWDQRLARALTGP